MTANMTTCTIMDTSDCDPSAAPLLVFRVLSDQGGRPAGLLAEVGPGPASGLQQVLDGYAFLTLHVGMPVLYRADLAPAFADALDCAGCTQLVPGTLLREDERLLEQDLPAGTLLIEGDWFMAEPARPTGAQAASRALALQLAALVAADAHTQDIEALLRKDPTLSYHLLRLVNTLGIGAGRRVTSFSQAILLLGRQQLRRWINLMLFAARKDDPRSAMLLARVAVRARLLELMGKAVGQDKPGQDQAFIAGMFSLLGVLFGMPLADVLAPLSMSQAVHDALLDYGGELGRMLQVCEAMEAGDFDALACHLAALRIDPAQFNDALIDANTWMLGVLHDG